MAQCAFAGKRFEPNTDVFLTMLLQLKENILIINEPQKLIFQSPCTKIVWNTPSPCAYVCMNAFAKEGGEEEAVFSEILEQEGEASAAKFLFFLERLKQHGFFVYHALFNGIPFASWVPLRENFQFELHSPNTPLVLSRFCLIRLQERDWILETPLFPGKIVLKHPLSTSILHSFCNELTLQNLKEKFAELPDSLIEDFISLLFSTKIVADPAEENTPLMMQWEFHDLYFHSRNRKGRHNNPSGGCYPFKGIIPAPETLKPLENFTTTPLFKPDIEQLKKQDLPFTYVLETRRSTRQSNGTQLNINKLGEFLYRCARIKKMREPKTIRTMGLRTMGLSERPYPSAGALFELEIYPVIHACAGIESGLYRYDPKEHQLLKYNGIDESVENLLITSKHCMGSEQIPSILFVITARFPRVSWKYRSTAYSLILKNIGTLMQTMYLVATAMELAPCANGAGDSDLFSQIIGANYLEESSVGEFVLF